MPCRWPTEEAGWGMIAINCSHSEGGKHPPAVSAQTGLHDSPAEKNGCVCEGTGSGQRREGLLWGLVDVL